MGMFESYNGRRHSLFIAAWIILGIIAVAGASAWAGYQWRQQEVDHLNQQVRRLNGEAAQLQNDITSLRNGQVPQQATPASPTRYMSEKGVTVYVYTPAKDSVVSSPAAVVGEVPGNWSFEASFPTKLLDSSGKPVAQTSAQLLGGWMTDQLVPFSAKLTFSSGNVASGEGILVLQKDNPSGQPSNDDSVSIPVKL